MIRAIAIDDEPVALDIIKAHADKIPFLQLRDTFLSARQAMTYMQSNAVDLVFLDISMPGMSGLEFAETVKHKANIIFTTAYAEHALKGFELAATDYILKPINFGRFLQACQLAESRMPTRSEDPREPEQIFVKDGYNWLPVKLNELLYIRGEDNYVSLVTKDKKILTRMTLAELQHKLPASGFLRVHKSYIVSLSKIEKIERGQLTIGGTKVALSMVSAEALLDLLNR